MHSKRAEENPPEGGTVMKPLSKGKREPRSASERRSTINPLFSAERQYLIEGGKKKRDFIPFGGVDSGKYFRGRGVFIHLCLKGRGWLPELICSFHKRRRFHGPAQGKPDPREKTPY